MMGQNGQPLNPYPGMTYGNMTAAAMMGLSSAYAGSQQAVAAAALQGRNPFSTGATYPSPVPAAAHANLYGAYQVQPMRSVPVHPDIRLVKLPFYDVHAELLRPASLLTQGANRFQEAQFQFLLTPSQATDIVCNRDLPAGGKLDYDYLYQIQLRFCPLALEAGKEMPDEFPPSVNVTVNGKMVQLPNPLATTKPGVEPKRPPKPVNITSYCKLSPIVHNNISIKWTAEYGKGWVVGVWLVMKCTSSDLLERLKKRGTRDASYTRGLIIDKLNDNDAEVATTSLKVSVLCPLGKMRMKVPCRPVTCNHLQCFDASTFLQMNERKPTWNCPVCDSKALYDTLLIDGYFQEILESKDLPSDENEIILERDGSWKPVPKEDETKHKSGPSSTSNGITSGNGFKRGADSADEGVECIELSDDEDTDPLPPLPPPAFLPPLPPLPDSQPPPPLPPMPREIECIELD